jgi:hypothetical protein
MPYFHLAMHLQEQFLQFGPLPGFGAYPYECNNCTLGHFNKNGHSGIGRDHDAWLVEDDVYTRISEFVS